ncbi:hypothetical protein [Streptomyces sp. NPDC101393]|uniref:hypothetical protein n=1 Tax=Streptomyces sp. NPDC101393 TaxID=3366141 RepID=UPI0038100852
MHLRDVLRNAPAAGALAASVTLIGGGAAAASDGTNQVVVQPDPVTPGGEFSVFDGGNCPGGTGEAAFDGAGIPTMKLSPLSNQVGGTGTVPEATKPGSYTVTVTCGAGGGSKAPSAEPGAGVQPGAEWKTGSAGHPGVGEVPGTVVPGEGDPGIGGLGEGDLGIGGLGEADPGTGGGLGESGPGTGGLGESGPGTGGLGEGDPGTGGLGEMPGEGQGTKPGKGHGGQETFTGTLTVSVKGAQPDRPREDVPQGGSHTGLGGGSGVSTATTALGGILLAGAAAWGVAGHHRRTRYGRH